MFIAMDESSLNRLVVGSIPTASTIFPFIINAFSTTKRARKEWRRPSVVLFITINQSTLVIPWSYLTVESSHHRENNSDLCRLSNGIGVIPLVTYSMNLLWKIIVSLYLLLASKLKEKPHETSRYRSRPVTRCCSSRCINPRPLPARHYHRPESGPTLPARSAELHAAATGQTRQKEVATEPSGVQL
jgi:hypothetical protein